VGEFIRAIAAGADNGIITTNWDIVVENRLADAGIKYNHGIPMHYVDGSPMPLSGVEVLKLHGSTHWLYCDSCRRVVSGRPRDPKLALHTPAFLESRDFTALNVPDPMAGGYGPSPMCPCCGARLSARVATFSYSKALEFYQFQGVWEAALRRLQKAKQWLFIGYSLPEADFELRHLLKTAELSTGGDRPEIRVVLGKDKAAVDRYQRFFGLSPRKIRRSGFQAWWSR
jgi:NAD-dependent SIR2 family protein deacetylase